MKILTVSVVLFFICLGAYAQKNIKLYEEEQNIIRLLANNFNANNVKEDSVYTFAIEIIPMKKGYAIETTDRIASEIFGNIDSLLSRTNFDLFQEKKARRRLILPIGIIVVNSGNENRGAIGNIEKLPSAIGRMFNVSDNKHRYRSIYLRPFFSILDKVIMY